MDLPPDGGQAARELLTKTGCFPEQRLVTRLPMAIVETPPPNIMPGVK
jgi:hypothetical protein